LGLKERNPDVVIALTDPHGAALHDYYATGELRAEGNSVAEGIGQSRITANLEGAPIDTQFRVSDEEGMEQLNGLLHEGSASACLRASTWRARSGLRGRWDPARRS
jgi:cysteine synthase A